MVPATDAPPGMLTAMTAPLRGVGTVFLRPSLWVLASIPTVLLAASGVLGIAVEGRLSARFANAARSMLGDGGIAHVGVFVTRIVVGLVFVAAWVLVATLVIPIASAPFMDALAARVDRGVAAKEPFVVQVLRSLRVGFAGVVLIGLPQLAVWGLSIALPILLPVWLGLGVTVSAFGLAFDALDWPLSRRGLGVRARFAWMRAHARLTLGLGLGVWTLALVPGLQIMLLPAIVVGGVSIVNAQEAWDRAR